MPKRTQEAVILDLQPKTKIFKIQLDFNLKIDQIDFKLFKTVNYVIDFRLHNVESKIHSLKGITIVEISNDDKSYDNLEVVNTYTVEEPMEFLGATINN